MARIRMCQWEADFNLGQACLLEVWILPQGNLFEILGIETEINLK